MSRHNPALLSMHSIIRRNAYAQAMFFFVDGCLSSSPAMSPREAILIFRDRFKIDDMDVASAVTTYNRMRGEYLTDNKIFDYDKCVSPGTGSASGFQ